MHIEAGAKLGDYEILAPIGAGGQGEVYRARDTVLGRTVAIKVLGPESPGTSSGNERLLREARAASVLAHPNVVTIHGIHSWGPLDFIVMEYVDGRTLRDLIPQAGFPAQQAFEYAIQIAAALQVAHETGIVHRDVKPGNIMIARSGLLKVLDFGLAKHIPPLTAADEAPTWSARLRTDEHAVVGTVAYMSPEQAQGKRVDARSDLFSFGAVLYEMLTGVPAFQGDSPQTVTASILRDSPPSLSKVRPELPSELDRVVRRCLEKDPGGRFASASELREDLLKAQARLGAIGSSRSALARPMFVVPALGVLLGFLAVGVYLLNRSSKQRWARNVALPEIVRLAEEEQDYAAAYRLAVEAEKYVPTDPLLTRIWDQVSRYTSVRTNPPGADVSWKEYGETQAPWEHLGMTPLEAVRIPVGFFHWRLERADFESVEMVSSGLNFPVADELGSIALLALGDVPEGMVNVTGGRISLNVPGLFSLPPVDLENYFIDRFEVSNRQFQKFVDSGGYRTREYWKEPFAREGRSPPWEEGVGEFRDLTGRPGPAGWELSRFPEGQEENPVTGISWYEAAAFCEFAGKQLPSLYHWTHAAGPDLSAQIVPASNFSPRGPAPVGSFQGLGPYGTYDMAGNVKEWAWNRVGEARYLLGGSWNEPTTLFNEADARSPSERAPTHGFRCMKLRAGGAMARAAADPVEPERIDAKPPEISEKEYQVFARLYMYDKTPLGDYLETTEHTADWRREKVSFLAAYGGERMAAFLFIPTGKPPPYQTVIYFPGSWALHALSSDEMWSGAFEFLVKSGRALCIPIYKGTYERSSGLKDDNPEATSSYRDNVIMWSKDLGRTLDYLETREDIDDGKLAYYGTSWGAGVGPIMVAIETRFKAAVFDAGGLWGQGTFPEVDPRTFAPRVRIPVLLVNGRYDHFFPLDSSQRPLFRLLGTPEPDKKHVVLESGHWDELHPRVQAILGWLDHYLGPVE